MPDDLRDRPALWRKHLDEIMEPTLTPEEEAQQAIEQAEADRARVEALEEEWGTRPEHLASQAAAMAMAGGEG